MNREMVLDERVGEGKAGESDRMNNICQKIREGYPSFDLNRMVKEQIFDVLQTDSRNIKDSLAWTLIILKEFHEFQKYRPRN